MRPLLVRSHPGHAEASRRAPSGLPFFRRESDGQLGLRIRTARRVLELPSAQIRDVSRLLVEIAVRVEDRAPYASGWIERRWTRAALPNWDHATLAELFLELLRFEQRPPALTVLTTEDRDHVQRLRRVDRTEVLLKILSKDAVLLGEVVENAVTQLGEMIVEAFGKGLSSPANNSAKSFPRHVHARETCSANEVGPVEVPGIEDELWIFDRQHFRGRVEVDEPSDVLGCGELG